MPEFGLGWWQRRTRFVVQSTVLPVRLSKAAQEKGGTFGIWIDEEDFVVEACVLGVVAVFEDGEAPPLLSVRFGPSHACEADFALTFWEVPRGALRPLGRSRRRRWTTCWTRLPCRR